MRKRCVILFLLLGIGRPFDAPDQLFGQDAVAVPAGASPAVVRGAPGTPPMAIGPDGKPLPPGQPSGPGRPGQPPPGGPTPDGKPAAPSATEAPKPVTRPDKPSVPPDPRELKVTPDPHGKIRFGFHGQPWADVLEWLAAVSAMSLDWQELPSDYLNLVTRRDYTIPEARDLINRHLLARGYTLLEHGEVLSVVKIDKLNPGLVPRVEPEQLPKRLPNEYVKVSFTLDWLISEKAVEELKPMLSPNAKVTALKNTNRVEAMDAAINLQEVYAMLTREQSDEPQQRLVKEFPLQHTRASDVIAQLKSLLGIESKTGPTGPLSPQQQMEAQQQAMMMQQQMQQRGGQPPAQPKKDEDVRLVANSRKNSILAHAPPDKMEIVSQAIKAIDVESDQTQSLLSNINRMQVYRLHGVDPDALVKTLLDIGQLDPATRLEVDAKNKAIIAYASLADHLTIRQVVERLDGSERKFDVVQLRRLEAEYVAGTIEFMMVGPPKQKQQPRYFDYYSSFNRSREEEKTDQFRVDADIENNRLLLWANEVELEEVTSLLAKLGEVPRQGGRSEKLRVLESLPPEQVRQLLEKIQQAWPSLAPNPLELPQMPATKAEGKAAPRFDPIGPKKEARFESPPLGDNRFVPVGGGLLLTEILGAANDEVGDAPTAQEPPRERKRPEPAPLPPVSISIAPDGRLVISSQDTRALDMLEELIGQVTPPRRDYRIYKLKHADSFWVRKNLEDFFDEEDTKKSNNSRTYYYYDYYSQQDNKSENQNRLSKRRKLKLIDDLDTNSILVQGADAEQLRTIEELIQVYDQPQESDANAARVSTVFQVRYSKAQTIAVAIKDVYRDLLSSNDKALASNNPEQKNRVPSGGITYMFNEGGEEGGDKGRTRVTFKGKLSIGVDEVTNTLLVSTEGENLMRNVSEMVRSLDEAAKPLSAVSVVKIGGNTNAAQVRDVLSRLLLESAKPANGQNPQSPRGPQNQSPGSENRPAAPPEGGAEVTQ